MEQGTRKMWDAASFVFHVRQYSVTQASSLVIQPLVLFNAIKIVLYQKPHAVSDCLFFGAKKRKLLFVLF